MKVNDLKGIIYATWVFVEKGEKEIDEIRYLLYPDELYKKYGEYNIECLTSFPAQDEKLIIKIKG